MSAVVQPGFSLRVIVQAVVIFMLLTFTVFWQRDFFAKAYFDTASGTLGLILNGAIVTVFFAGFSRLLWLLRHYDAEEKALAEFEQRLVAGREETLEGINSETLIMRRWHGLKALHERGVGVDHSALAAIQLAGESQRATFPKFVNNILILLGVLGTIVSLSLALFGASKLLSAMDDLSNMGLVIQGMSGALSTTMTAIVTYVIFSYLYHKLLDAQTNVVAWVEYITVTQLLPRFQTTESDALDRFSALLLGCAKLFDSLNLVHERIATACSTIEDLAKGQFMSSMSSDMTAIRGLIREGFRLEKGAEA